MFKNIKYPKDTKVKINDETWMVEGYRNKFGKELVYTLRYEGVDGNSPKTMELNEDSLEKIIESGSSEPFMGINMNEDPVDRDRKRYGG